MYISNNNASLLSNGNLLIFTDCSLNHSKYTNNSYEISPFKKGLFIENNKDGSKSSANHTGGINLINYAHNNNPKLIIHQFLDGIPEEIIHNVGNYLYAQTPMLQLCAQFKSAQDLLLINPNLLWIISDDYNADNLQLREIKPLLEKKQKNIIKSLFPDNEESNQYVKFLSKIVLHQGDRKEFSILETAISDLGLSIIKKMNHWPQIPIRILEIIFERPELANNKLIQSMAKNHIAVKNKILEETIYDLSVLFRDTILLGEAIEINNLKFVIEKIETQDQLNILHDKWLKRSFNKKNLNNNGIFFPPPPILGNSEIIPLITEQELFLEGKELNHCVYTCKKMIVDGYVFIYKMIKPERCTIEIIILDNSIFIGQIYKHSNVKVLISTERIIKKWVDTSTSTCKKRAA